MVKLTVLEKYTSILEATLGAVAAHTVATSANSSKVVRDLSKQLNGISVELRKELILLDKTLVKHD